MVGTAVAVVVVATLLGLSLWLRAYAPLDGRAGGTFAPGPGLGADVEPTFGSGGKPVYIPAYRKGGSFDATFTLHNTGRFGVTVTGLAGEATGPLAPAAVLDPGRRRPISDLRIDPHETALVDVRWRLDCRPGTPHEVSSDRVRLRYRYLSLFTRTESVELPFAVTLRCSGGPPSSP